MFADAERIISEKKIKNLDKVKIDLSTGKLTNVESGETFSLMPFSKVQKDIYDSGSLLNI
jgi:hypothetical protein